MRMRKLVAMMSMLFLAGCSSTTFLYNRLDVLLPWYIGGYVDLDREQKKLLDELLEPFLAWHRAEELPRYLVIIEDMQALLDREATPQDIADIAASFEAAWFRLEEKGLEWMLLLGAELTDEQMDAFVAQLWEKQAEYEEEYLERTDEEYAEEAYDNLRESAEDFMGRLDWGQRAMLEEAAQSMQRSDAIWLTERAGWIARLEVMLQREPGWQQEILDAIATRDDTVSQEYLDAYTNNTEVIYAALAKLVNSRDEKQDKRLRRQLASYHRDVKRLIR